VSELELGWLAGLLEGEGTFTPHRCTRKLKKKPGWRYVSYMPRVQIQTQDKDVAQRVADLVGSNLLGPYSNKRTKKATFSQNKYKPCWVVSFAGAKAAEYLTKMRPLMGERRKSQFDHALHLWERKGWHEPT